MEKLLLLRWFIWEENAKYLCVDLHTKPFNLRAQDISLQPPHPLKRHTKKVVTKMTALYTILHRVVICVLNTGPMIQLIILRYSKFLTFHQFHVFVLMRKIEQTHRYFNDQGLRCIENCYLWKIQLIANNEQYMIPSHKFR